MKKKNREIGKFLNYLVRGVGTRDFMRIIGVMGILSLRYRSHFSTCGRRSGFPRVPQKSEGERTETHRVDSPVTGSN